LAEINILALEKNSGGGGKEEDCNQDEKKTKIKKKRNEAAVLCISPLRVNFGREYGTNSSPYSSELERVKERRQLPQERTHVLTRRKWTS
jgi:hypothetical protein